MFGLNLYMLGAIGLGIVALIGSITAYNIAENNGIRKATTAVVKAEAERKTMEAIDALSNKADQARVKLLYCRNDGKLYDFAGNKCL